MTALLALLRPLAAGLLVSLALGLGPAISRDDLIIVRPAEIRDVLVNPGMGITTFQRFNGNALNTGLTWSEEGPIPERPPPTTDTPPDFPIASIAYCRWFWSELQPSRDHIRWEILDFALAEARKHGQTLAIRLMPYDENHPLPEWYRESGARRANRPEDADGGIWQPDFADQRYREHWGALIAAVGARYDGHPDLDTVDISNIGYWGEGWSDYMPPLPVQKELVDLYLAAFRRTRVLMNDESRALAYATGRGAGWRLDCWGDMGKGYGAGFFSHMLDVYPQQIARLGLQDVWKSAPVSLETCGVPGLWWAKGWDIDAILAQALRWHVSSVNVKSSAIPPEWRDKFEEFQNRMGYRIVLRRFSYPRAVRAGQAMAITSWWLNAGVAPIYREYRVALRLSGAASSAIMDLPIDVRTWLPGDAVFDGDVSLSDTLPPGIYTLAVGLLDERTDRPAIRLGNEGREPDGWYRVGDLTVVK